MDMTLAYLGRSGRAQGGGLRLAPNLTRDAVAFSGSLKEPLRFREAISALHDVVVNDLRVQPRDKTAYEAYRRREAARVSRLRAQAFEAAKEEALVGAKASPDLEARYRSARHRYWRARSKYSTYLLQHDRALWRKLMPCDPVITVADDVVFFECFSADESSYGCLTVARDAFGGWDDAQRGTTNVDYSWDLFDAFQSLRTYRNTRLEVDPEGFSVRTENRPDYREEKIELPPGWLRGFMQVQAAMGLPMRRVSLDRETVYSLLAFLRRHRARRSPRAVRFELRPGRAPALVLEPTETRLVSHSTRYDGPDIGPTRLWGRRRLLVLGRLLPLIERVDVYMLGTGLPSFWVARMGTMRLTLGLSGWTTNDWTRNTALDLLMPPGDPKPYLVERLATRLRAARQASFAELEAAAVSTPADVAATLNHLAHTGQVIHDLDAGVYRWRQIMPMALGEAQLGGENEEVAAARVLTPEITVAEVSESTSGFVDVRGGYPYEYVSLRMDRDGTIRGGSCTCSHHFRNKLRMGPCRHLLALRTRHQRSETPTSSLRMWFQNLIGNR